MVINYQDRKAFLFIERDDRQKGVARQREVLGDVDSPVTVAVLLPDVVDALVVVFVFQIIKDQTFLLILLASRIMDSSAPIPLPFLFDRSGIDGERISRDRARRIVRQACCRSCYEFANSTQRI